MAVVCKIGTATQYSGATAYDLKSYIADNVFVMDHGRLPERQQGNEIIMTFRCHMRGSSVANMVNAEQSLLDKLVAAENYASDLHYDEPTYIYDSDDGETVKRAVLTRGYLEPERNRIPEDKLNRFYTLQLYRKSWEGVTETTAVNEVEFDGNSQTQVIAAPSGDIPGRISELTIAATGDNTSENPLTQIWGGIKPLYGASTVAYDPIWNLELATLSTGGTTSGSLDGGAYDAIGGGTDNCVLWTGGATMTKICTISYNQAKRYVTGNLVTNGDAETGDFTGWTTYSDSSTTQATITITSEAAYVNSGSYAFLVEGSGALGDQTGMFQAFSATAGNSYLCVGSMARLYSTTGNVPRMSFFFATYSGATTCSTSDKIMDYDEYSSDYNTFEAVGVCPTGFNYIIAYPFVEASGATSTLVAFDDIAAYDITPESIIGDYLALIRVKLDAAGEYSIYGTFGYTGSDERQPLGDPQQATNTSWKLIPLGVVSFPPDRRLSDDEAIKRLGNLGFDLYAQEISGSANLLMDAIVLIPYKHRFWVNNASVAQSATYSYSSKTANLHIYTEGTGETVVIAESEDFTGINANIEQTVANWDIPIENCVLCVFAQTDTVHTITNDFDVTMKYYPRYRFRNTD